MEECFLIVFKDDYNKNKYKFVEAVKLCLINKKKIHYSRKTEIFRFSYV